VAELQYLNRSDSNKVTGAGQNHRVIELGSIASALGSAKIAVLSVASEIQQPLIHFRYYVVAGANERRLYSQANITGCFFLIVLRAEKPSETQTRT